MNCIGRSFTARVEAIDRDYTARVEADPDQAGYETTMQAVAVERAPKALAALETAKTELHRFFAIPQATLAAYTLGRFSEARALATKALDLAATRYPNLGDGEAVNSAHTVLGLIGSRRHSRGDCCAGTVGND